MLGLLLLSAEGLRSKISLSVQRQLCVLQLPSALGQVQAPAFDVCIGVMSQGLSLVVGALQCGCAVQPQTIHQRFSRRLALGPQTCSAFMVAFQACLQRGLPRFPIDRLGAQSQRPVCLAAGFTSGSNFRCGHGRSLRCTLLGAQRRQLAAELQLLAVPGCLCSSAVLALRAQVLKLQCQLLAQLRQLCQFRQQTLGFRRTRLALLSPAGLGRFQMRDPHMQRLLVFQQPADVCLQRIDLRMMLRLQAFELRGVLRTLGIATVLCVFQLCTEHLELGHMLGDICMQRLDLCLLVRLQAFDLLGVVDSFYVATALHAFETCAEHVELRQMLGHRKRVPLLAGPESRVCGFVLGRQVRHRLFVLALRVAELIFCGIRLCLHRRGQRRRLCCSRFEQRGARLLRVQCLAQPLKLRVRRQAQVLHFGVDARGPAGDAPERLQRVVLLGQQHRRVGRWQCGAIGGHHHQVDRVCKAGPAFGGFLSVVSQQQGSGFLGCLVVANNEDGRSARQVLPVASSTWRLKWRPTIDLNSSRYSSLTWNSL